MQSTLKFNNLEQFENDNINKEILIFNETEVKNVLKPNTQIEQFGGDINIPLLIFEGEYIWRPFGQFEDDINKEIKIENITKPFVQNLNDDTEIEDFWNPSIQFFDNNVGQVEDDMNKGIIIFEEIEIEDITKPFVQFLNDDTEVKLEEEYNFIPEPLRIFNNE